MVKAFKEYIESIALPKSKETQVQDEILEVTDQMLGSLERELSKEESQKAVLVFDEGGDEDDKSDPNDKTLVGSLLDDSIDDSESLASSEDDDEDYIEVIS